MKSCTVIFSVMFILGASTAWSQGFRGSAGFARSAGSWGNAGGGRIGVTSGTSGSNTQIIGPGGQIVVNSVPFNQVGGFTVFATPQFVTRVAPVSVFVPNQFPFAHHGRVFRHPGIVFVDVPSYVDITVTTTQYGPGGAWPQPPLIGYPPADSRLRAPGQLAPFDPTPGEVVERMLSLAGVKKGDVVYDLGAGDGRMVIGAAKKYAVRAVGFEIDPGLVKLARENVRKQGVEKLVEIRQQNFMTADLSHATVVLLYLSYDGNLALRPRLMNELKPGARVVSNTFDMGDWQPKIVETYRDGSGDTHLLYYWEISAPEVYGANER